MNELPLEKLQTLLKFIAIEFPEADKGEIGIWYHAVTDAAEEKQID